MAIRMGDDGFMYLTDGKGNARRYYYHGGKRDRAGRRSLYPPPDGEKRRPRPVYCDDIELAMIKTLLTLHRMGRGLDTVHDIARIAILSDAARPGTTVAKIASYIKTHDD